MASISYYREGTNEHLESLTLQTIKICTPQELKQWLGADSIHLIDVREPSEYQAAHIPQAHNFPLSSFLKAKAETLKNFAHREKIVLYCQAGTRSHAAYEHLRKHGFTENIWQLKNGFNAWKKEQFHCVQSTKYILPIERQVHITVGTLGLLGTLFGYFYSPLFLVIPAIIGAGLLNAGLTGWCGLAKFLAKMPWNKN